MPPCVQHALCDAVEGRIPGPAPSALRRTRPPLQRHHRRVAAAWQVPLVADSADSSAATVPHRCGPSSTTAATPTVPPTCPSCCTATAPLPVRHAQEGGGAGPASPCRPVLSRPMLSHRAAVGRGPAMHWLPRTAASQCPHTAHTHTLHLCRPGHRVRGAGHERAARLHGGGGHPPGGQQPGGLHHRPQEVALLALLHW